MSVTRRPVMDASEAQKIMGSNFFGLEFLSEHFGAATGEDKRAEILFSREVLGQCANSHVLVLQSRLSMASMAEDCPELFCSKPWEDSEAYSFAYNYSEPRWFLLQKTLVDESKNEVPERQVALLSANEEIPQAVQVVSAVRFYLLHTGIWLFDGEHARCCEEPTSGWRAEVWSNWEGKVRISISPSDSRHPDLGIASLRKPDLDI